MPRTSRASRNNPESPTLADVATTAGVSTATVSRVLNQPGQVSIALRDRVMRAVEGLGYVPNAGARALSLKRSGTFGAVIPTIDNAIFARGVQAFQQRIIASNFQLLVAFTDYDPAQELAQSLNLISRGVDGIVLTGSSQQPELLDRLARRGIPWIHAGSWPGPRDAPCVGFRNREAMRGAVRYLIDLGHRRFAMLAGVTTGNDRAADRVAGVRDALKQEGLELPAHALVESPYEIGAARNAAAQLLAPGSPARRPTAVLCGNDVLAYGAMLEAVARNIHVPNDLSIIGFDDLAMSRHWQPALTTVHVPIEHMWTIAADQLIARVADPALPGESVEIDIELVVRASTGRVPAGRRKPA